MGTGVAHRLWKEMLLQLLWAFSSTLTSHMIWRPFFSFFFNKPLEIAVEGRSKGLLWFFPSLLVLLNPAPQGGVSVTQRNCLSCSAPQGDAGRVSGPPWCDQCKGFGGCLSPVGSCLGLSISSWSASGQCHLEKHSIPGRGLGACLTDIPSPLPVTFSSLRLVRADARHTL